MAETEDEKRMRHLEEGLQQEFFKWRQLQLSPDQISVPHWEILAQFRALAQILVDAGLVTQTEYEEKTIEQKINVLSNLREQIGPEMKKQKIATPRSGIIGPNGKLL